MTKRKVQAKIGNKMLSIDNPDEVDASFIQEFKSVAKTKPNSLQEFFARLVELQRKNSSTKNPRTIEIPYDGNQVKRTRR